MNTKLGNNAKETNSFIPSSGASIHQCATKLKENQQARILRLALKNNCNSSNPNKVGAKAFHYMAQQLGVSEKFDYLVTPGGFMLFEWPKEYHEAIKDQTQSQKLIPALRESANVAVEEFWNSLPASMRDKIKSSVKFIMFGIDSNNYHGFDTVQGIQFVALFNTSKGRVIHSTGKSYPTPFEQKHRLIEFLDLKSHFKTVNGEMICLLGCHDLKLFSPRLRAVAGKERQIKIKAIDNLMKTFKPNLIIQHPHATDS